MTPLTPEQLAYLAGAFDGEGQLSIIKNIRSDDKKRLRNYALRVEVRLGQRRRLWLDTIQSWVGEDNASLGRNGAAQAFYILRFKAAWCREYLPLIRPYLILKGANVDIIMEFFALATPHRGRIGAGDEVWAKRDALHVKIKHLNADRSNSHDVMPSNESQLTWPPKVQRQLV